MTFLIPVAAILTMLVDGALCSPVCRRPFDLGWRRQARGGTLLSDHQCLLSTFTAFGFCTLAKLSHGTPTRFV